MARISPRTSAPLQLPIFRILFLQLWKKQETLFIRIIQQGKYKSEFRHEQNFVPGADQWAEYLNYPRLALLPSTLLLEVEQPVHRDEVLYDGLQQELEPGQQLNHWEVCRMFCIAENHLGHQFVLLHRLQVISLPDSSRVAPDVLADIGRQTSPLLLGQFDVEISGDFLQASSEAETVEMFPVVRLGLTEPGLDGFLM